jgi:hypothetical protein
MHQQLWGYKVEEKLYLGVSEQKSLNNTDLERVVSVPINYLVPDPHFVG